MPPYSSSRQVYSAVLAGLVLLLPGPLEAAQSMISVSSASVQLSPAVMLIGKFDWQIDPDSKPGQPWSRWAREREHAS